MLSVLHLERLTGIYFEDLKSNIDILKHQLSKQEDALVDKERESARRVQAAREEEWKKLSAVESDK